jgi:aubergine-like protein
MPVKLSANYFQLLKKPNFEMIQYRVDFEPDIESTMVRKKLLHDQIPSQGFGGRIFDGSSLFLMERIPQEPMRFTAKNEAGGQVQITIRFASTVSMNDMRGLQILNLTLRKCMENMDLQLVGRHYFDPTAKVEVSNEI